MKSVTVASTIDDSTKLQSLIDSTGNTPTVYVFPYGQDIEINSRLRFYNFTEWSGNDCNFTLADNVSTSVFPSGIPLISPKDPTAAEGICFHNLNFDGNRDNNMHVASSTTNKKAWGNGFHNFIMLGVLNGVSYNNSKNCEFYNINYKNSLGDLLRVEGGQNISAHDITASRGGHDVICLAGTDGGGVYNLTADMSVNAAVRTRSSKNIKIHDCKLNGNTGVAYSPGIEIQSTAKNWISENIEIYNNEIRGTYGPGIQVAGTVPGNGLVSIHNNLFDVCGNMPAVNKIPGVGAIVFDGFPVKIQNNTVVNSMGYGIMAGAYNVSSSYSFAGNISRNIVTGTRKSNYPGPGSGSGIANLIQGRYSLDCSQNCLCDNLTSLYNITQTGGITADPLFTDDYHLQANSPCRFPEYELGAYTDVESSTEYLIECAYADTDIISKSITCEHEIYRRIE